MERSDSPTTVAELVPESADLREETAALDAVSSARRGRLAQRDAGGRLGHPRHDRPPRRHERHHVRLDHRLATRPVTEAQARPRAGGIRRTDPSSSTRSRRSRRGRPSARRSRWRRCDATMSVDEDVVAWWRSSSARLIAPIGGLDPEATKLWGPNMISPLSLGSARMMETWAHSLDVHEAAGASTYSDTDRDQTRRVPRPPRDAERVHARSLTAGSSTAPSAIRALDVAVAARNRARIESQRPRPPEPKSSRNGCRARASPSSTATAAPATFEPEGPDAEGTRSVKHARASFDWLSRT